MSAADRPDPAVFLYTSGTTADPKGVVLTHDNLLAEFEGVQGSLYVDEHDSILGILPLFHALALMGNLFLPLLLGAVYAFAIVAGSGDAPDGASFGTLALSNHVGFATLGALLLIGVFFVLLANLALLPALLAWRRPPAEGGSSTPR